MEYARLFFVVFFVGACGPLSTMSEPPDMIHSPVDGADCPQVHLFILSTLAQVPDYDVGISSPGSPCATAPQFGGIVCLTTFDYVWFDKRECAGNAFTFAEEPHNGTTLYLREGGEVYAKGVQKAFDAASVTNKSDGWCLDNAMNDGRTSVELDYRGQLPMYTPEQFTWRWIQ